MEFDKSIENRRSYYGISNKSPISDERITELTQHAVKYTPSAFNTQSPNVIICFEDSHKKVWEITLEALRKIVPEESFAETESKINSFMAGHGTILYFNDDSITENMQKAYPIYADNFPIWAEQANGMLQFAVWSLLESEGLGASLQHYNQLISAGIASAFSTPTSWRLIAQMPFGSPTAQPEAKEFADITARVKIFK